MRNRQEREVLFRALACSRWVYKSSYGTDTSLYNICPRTMAEGPDPYVELTVELEDILLDQFWVTLHLHTPLGIDRIGPEAYGYAHIHYGEPGILLPRHTVALKPPTHRGRSRRTIIVPPDISPHERMMLGLNTPRF
jgi:hypothetical protein